MAHLPSSPTRQPAALLRIRSSSGTLQEPPVVRLPRVLHLRRAGLHSRAVAPLTGTILHPLKMVLRMTVLVTHPVPTARPAANHV